MARRGGNIMRSIRIQLKTGFMKEEPEEYLFMKRYPPIRRDSQNKFFKVNTEKVPYMDLLEKAAARNPRYSDRVYPAYWQDEPVGLTLAKKQYQFIQNGDSEDDAYRKAELYIDELENKSYVELKKVNAALAEAGAKAPFLNDEALLQEILQWQALLKNVPYRTLSLADQGEVDFLLQTKVLKWKEGDRERRMKDPMFVAQFEQLRTTIFPNPYEAVKEAKKKATLAKRQFCDEFGVKYEQARPEFSFYVQDYIKWFAKLQVEPDTFQWRMEDRSIFSNWIIDTLALKCELNSRHKGPKENQAYLNLLKYQFFPMTRPGANPEQKYETPTVDSLRRVMFENEIGYKRQNGMVFVRRFYRIPSLLFPEDTLLAAIIAEKHYAEGIVKQNDEEMLLSEIRGVGLDEAKMPQIMSQLRAYVEKANLDLPDYKNEATSSSNGANDQENGADSSIDAVLGGIINDALGDDFSSKRPQPAKSTIAEKVEEIVSKEEKDSSSSSSSDSSDSESDDAESAYPHHRKLYKQLYAIEDIHLRDDFLLKTVDTMSDEETAAFMTPLLHDSDDSDVDEDELTPLERKERLALIDKYVKPATTELERDRDEMLRQNDGLPVSQARDETDMFMVREWRLEQDVRSRARAEFEYEEKEVARRQREFEKRRLWKMPRPLVPIIGYKEV